MIEDVIGFLKRHRVHCFKCNKRIYADSYSKQEKYHPLHLYKGEEEGNFFYCGMCKKYIKQ